MYFCNLSNPRQLMVDGSKDLKADNRIILWSLYRIYPHSVYEVNELITTDWLAQIDQY